MSEHEPAATVAVQVAALSTSVTMHVAGRRARARRHDRHRVGDVDRLADDRRVGRVGVTAAVVDAEPTRWSAAPLAEPLKSALPAYVAVRWCGPAR